MVTGTILFNRWIFQPVVEYIHMNSKRIVSCAAIFALLLPLSSFASTWAAPAQGTTPPGNNAAAPASAAGDQVIKGGLIINWPKDYLSPSDQNYNGSAETGLTVLNGNLAVPNGSLWLGAGYPPSQSPSVSWNPPKGSLQVGTTGGSSQICLNGTTRASCITAWPSGGTSQWTTSGSNISYTAGNVGIGTASPSGKLEINLTNPSGWSGNNTALKIISPDSGYNLSLNTYVVGGGNVGYQFSPNGNTGMVITTPGNVGVGNANPKASLSVGNSDMINLYRYADNALAIQTTLDDQPIGTYGGSENRLLLQPVVGNVGIGTASPNGKLDVATTPANNYLDGIVMGQTDGDNTESIQTYIDTGAGGGYGSWNYATGCCHPLYINPHGGDVNIGNLNTSPSPSNLTVQGNVTASSFYGDGSHLSGIVSSNPSQWTTSGSNIYYNSGNVGIGTASPNAKLTVGAALGGTTLGTTFITNAGALGTSAGNERSLADIGFTSGNNSSLGIRAYRTANGSDWGTTAIGLGMNVDNSLRVNNADLWLSANGNVGIGTVSPGQKLDVNGNINASGSLCIGGTCKSSWPTRYIVAKAFAQDASSKIGTKYRWDATASCSPGSSLLSGGYTGDNGSGFSPSSSDPNFSAVTYSGPYDLLGYNSTSGNYNSNESSNVAWLCSTALLASTGSNPGLICYAICSTN